MELRCQCVHVRTLFGKTGSLPSLRAASGLTPLLLPLAQELQRAPDNIADHLVHRPGAVDGAGIAHRRGQRPKRSPLALGFVSAAILLPTVAALALVAWYGKETRGRDLRDLDPDGHTFVATGI